MTNLKKLTNSFIFISLILLGSCSEQTIDEVNFGSLKGKIVTKGLNTPIENVKITTNPASTTVFTDGSGNFNIEEISVGEYSIQAEKDEYDIAFEPTNIFEDKTSNVVFELDSISTFNISPIKAILLAPKDEEKVLSNPVDFTWNSSKNDDDDIKYTLELRNGASGEIQNFNSIIDTTYTVNNLEIGVNYFWQVTATDEQHEPIQSDVFNFQLQNNSENRFLFVKNIEGNSVIFSGGEPVENAEVEFDQNVIQLTPKSTNSYRPKRSRNNNKIAFIRTQGGESHLFGMNEDGTDTYQITNDVPISGFKQEELEFAWHSGGGGLYYPNFNKLYSINSDGSNIQLVYETTSQEFISEIATSSASNLIVVKMNNTLGYNARIVLINPTTGQETMEIVNGVTGALGGIDFSVDGKKILYTQDISATENIQYRQLDSRIFEYTIESSTVREVISEKGEGFNALDAKYSPNGAWVVFTHTSNDGISAMQINRALLNPLDDNSESETLFSNAYMCNWE